MISTLAQFYIKVFVIRSDEDYSYNVHSPNDLSVEFLQEVSSFRSRHYEQSCPYLLSTSQAEIESKLLLDERSYHVIARSKLSGEIVGALRLTPAPFELSELFDISSLQEADYINKLEIGRLITNSSVRNVGKKMMMLAGIFSSENTTHNGFFGTCRAEKMTYFEKFGMKIVSQEVSLRGRPNTYFIISSDFKTMRINVLKNFVSRLSHNPFKSKDKYERLSGKIRV